MRMGFRWPLLIALACTSCSTQRGGHHYSYSGSRLSVRAIEDVLRAHPLDSGQNIRVTDLGGTTTVSHHIVQAGAAERLHVHEEHDLTVFIYRGHGRMLIGKQEFDVKRGDIVLVPRQIPHAFVNGSDRPSVAVVVFTPAFDGRDTVPVALEK